MQSSSNIAVTSPSDHSQGSGQLLGGWAEHGLRVELEEIADSGELVMVCVRTPKVDAHHGWRRSDRAYGVFTVREGRVVALRDCRDRQEALRLAGIQS